MLIAVFNNLPEIALGVCWSTVMFWLGRKFERWFVQWKASRKA